MDARKTSISSSSHDWRGVSEREGKPGSLSVLLSPKDAHPAHIFVPIVICIQCSSKDKELRCLSHT